MKIKLPKYASLTSLLLVLYLVDYVYFLQYRKNLRLIKQKLIRAFLYFYHFIPFILAFFFIFAINQKNIGEWKPIFRTYSIGIIILIFIPRIAMAAVYTLYMLVWNINRLRRRQTNQMPFHIMAVVLGTATLVVELYSTLYTTFNLKTEYVQIDNKVPKGLDTYRIVQISDFHIGSFVGSKFVNRVVDSILNLKPDMIVFTGDMVNFSTEELLKHTSSLERLKARDGVYTVLGNHDYGDYVEWDNPKDKKENELKLKRLYEQMGWRVLDNEGQIIKRKDATIRLLGVENWGDKDRFPRLGDIEKAKNSVEIDSSSLANCYTVLLSHDPSHFDSIVYPLHKDINLTLSGHTHGMQAGIIIKGKDYTLAHTFYEHDAGRYDFEDGRILYVNTGVGFNGLPFRFGINPIISCLDFVSEK